MAAEETLFNATLVLIPVWLGVIRYIVTEAEFETKSIANIVGLGTVFVLVGILFPMWEAIKQMVAQSPELDIALYVLFTTVGLTGLGGVLFIIREIRHISGIVITSVPTGISLIGLSVLLVPKVIEQPPDSSVDIFLLIVQVFIILLTFFVLFHEIAREKPWQQDSTE